MPNRPSGNYKRILRGHPGLTHLPRACVRVHSGENIDRGLRQRGGWRGDSLESGARAPRTRSEHNNYARNKRVDSLSVSLSRSVTMESTVLVCTVANRGHKHRSPPPPLPLPPPDWCRLRLSSTSTSGKHDSAVLIMSPRARGSGNAAHVRLAIRCGYVARQGTTRGIVGSMHARSFGLLSGRGDSRSRGGGRRGDRHRARGMLGAVFEPGESQNRSGDSKLELFQFQSRRS